MDAAALLAAKQLRQATVSLNLGGGETVDVHIRALPRRQYRQLLEAHPPAGDNADWNPDTFPPALIAASAVDPTFTVEQATQLWDEWEAAESGLLFLACWQLNDRTAGTSFTLPGFVEAMNDSGPNSATATNGASPTPSS